MAVKKLKTNIKITRKDENLLVNVQLISHKWANIRNYQNYNPSM